MGGTPQAPPSVRPRDPRGRMTRGGPVLGRCPARARRPAEDTAPGSRPEIPIGTRATSTPPRPARAPRQGLDRPLHPAGAAHPVEDVGADRALPRGEREVDRVPAADALVERGTPGGRLLLRGEEPPFGVRERETHSSRRRLAAHGHGSDPVALARHRPGITRPGVLPRRRHPGRDGRCTSAGPWFRTAPFAGPGAASRRRGRTAGPQLSGLRSRPAARACSTSSVAKSSSPWPTATAAWMSW